jgi:hypothetical protein
MRVALRHSQAKAGIAAQRGRSLARRNHDRHDSVGQREYTNLSNAFLDLIRDRLVTEQTAATGPTVVLTVTLICDHHAHAVTEKLMELQHTRPEWWSPPATRTRTTTPAWRC